MMPFLVGVLHRLADRGRTAASARAASGGFVAEVGDGDALDQFHDEVGPAAARCAAGVEDAGDVLMVHQGQGLPLGLEAGDDLASLSMPGLMILRATRRRTGSCCSAM